MAIGKWDGFKMPELILSALVFAAMCWFVDVGKLIEIISKTDIPLFIAAIFVYFSTTLLMSYRIRLILRALGEKISFLDAFKSNIGGLIASDFSPGRAGYFVTPVILSRIAGTPLDKGVVTIVAPQMVEFFIKAAGATAAIFLVAFAVPLISQNSLFLWIGVSMMLSFCAAMWLALFYPPFLSFAKAFSFIPLVPEACSFVATMQAHRQKVASVALPIILISVLVFIIKGLECFLFAAALGIRLENLAVPPVVAFMLLQPLISIFQFVPIPTIAGLGLSEGSAVVSMSLLGVAPEVAVAYVLLIRGGCIIANSPGILFLSEALFSGKKPSLSQIKR